jgi:hypothetical protein
MRGRKRRAMGPPSRDGRKKRRNEVEVEIADDIFPDEIVRNLIDNCLIPIMVDRFIENMRAEGACERTNIDVYNICLEDVPDVASKKRKRAPAQTGTVETDTETANPAHTNGVPRPEQIRGRTTDGGERSDTSGRTIPVGARRR